MHQTEANQLDRCADCGAEIVPGRERSFTLNADSDVCFACAVRRGGRYDERLDRWDPPPDVADLLERERPVEHALTR